MTCKYAHLQDTGYSNYTVEGTDFSCMRGAHPDGTFDKYYGEDERLKYAQKCDQYVEGTPIEFDVDGGYEAKLTDEERQRLKEWEVIKLISM